MRIMRTKADAGVKRLVEMQPDGCTGLVQRLTVQADEHRKGIATFFKTYAAWRIDVELDALRRFALRHAELQAGQSRAVLRGVGIGAVGIEALPKNENGFTMLAVRPGLNGIIDVGREREIAGNLLPQEMKSVRGRPEIGT